MFVNVLYNIAIYCIVFFYFFYRVDLDNYTVLLLSVILCLECKYFGLRHVVFMFLFFKCIFIKCLWNFACVVMI